MAPKIILVNPNPRYTKLRIGGIFPQPPLGLAYLAASLEQGGFKVEILDSNIEALSPQETAEKIIRSPAQYIGFTSDTLLIPLVFQISSLVKSKSKDSKFIFIGGPHVTYMSKQTLQDCQSIDAVVRGEGENTVCELIKKLEERKALSEVKGITFRKGKEIVENPDRKLIEDIDTIPFPAWHLLPLSLYFLFRSSFFSSWKGRYAPVITSRGCPNRCVFCEASFFWKRLRLRSPENIIAELELLIKQYRVSHVVFVDSTFNFSRERVVKICQLILKNGLNIQWSCEARADNITPELVDLMKRAGCKIIALGIESGNQEILDRIKKNITLEQIREAVGIVKKANLKLVCYFMIGLPGDTKETVKQTINFAKELNPHVALFSPTIPLPGTALYEDYLKRGLLKGGYIWQNFFFPVNTTTLTNKEIQDLCREAYRRFYWRPALIWEVLRDHLKRPYILIYTLKVFYFLTTTSMFFKIKKKDLL